MNTKTQPRPDQNSVAIGGVGGSGTRLIADILIKLGFYMGGSLNEAHDNLWFTLLFKRPDWFDLLPPDDVINDAVTLLQKAMTTGLSSNALESETNHIWNAVEQLERSNRTTGASRDTAEQLITSNPPNFERQIGWGWKEPNTHIFLPQMYASIQGLKYIHVIRNGLDMALSKNQQQLQNWGAFFSLQNLTGNSSLTSQSLDYWIAANNRAIEIGTRQYGDRFLLINYDQFCLSPSKGINGLANFLEVALSPEKTGRLMQSIRPKSIGRYKDIDINSFSRSQLESVRKLGFNIND